jgi:hypothetical protein
MLTGVVGLMNQMKQSVKKIGVLEEPAGIEEFVG